MARVPVYNNKLVALVPVYFNQLVELIRLIFFSPPNLF